MYMLQTVTIQIYFQKFRQMWTQQIDFKIISGYFNCVLDSGLYKSGGRKEHANNRSQLFLKHMGRQK